MSDEEVICGFMEPKPEHNPSEYVLGEIYRTWWVRSIGNTWRPLLDDEFCSQFEKLGRLHEVEARLTEEQWCAYQCAAISAKWGDVFGLICHASAGQKIRALASVLRGEK